ncbi:MAG: hypothetical protein AB1426_07010 [Bacillota bacterium]
MPGEKRLLHIALLLMVALALTAFNGNHLTSAVGEDTYGSVTTDAYHDTDPPAPPTGLTVTDPGTGEALYLRWNTSTEPDLLGYRIYRSVSSETYAPPDESYQRLGSGMVDTTDTNHTDNSVSRNVYYFYRITAVDQSGNESRPSNPSSTFATDISPPAQPQGFKVTELDTGRDVELEWRKNIEPDLAGYQLYRAANAAGPFELVQILGTNETSYKDTGLTQGQWYYYYLIAVDADGNGSNRTQILSVQPRQAVRAEFDQEGARMPASLQIQPDCSAVFLNVPGDSICVSARALDENGNPVPLKGTIRFAAAFGRFEDPEVNGEGDAQAIFKADETGGGKIAVEYYPMGAETPALVDDYSVRALEWHISLSASGDRTVTGSDDVTLSCLVTDQDGRPVTDWQARVVFETVKSPELARKDGHRKHYGRWHGKAHAVIVREKRTSGAASGPPGPEGEVEARWVASTTPGTTRVQAVLYYDALLGPDYQPKRVCESGTCTIKVDPGPAHYVGFDPDTVRVNGKEQRITVQAFDAFGNITPDYGDLKIWVQAPDGAPVSFSADNGETWSEPGTWVPVKPGQNLLVRVTDKKLPDRFCLLVTKVEDDDITPPPGVAQVNLPLRVDGPQGAKEK